MYVYIYIYIYVCMYIHTYTYRRTSLQYATALRHSAFVSVEAGCQSGGSRSINRPIEIGDALIRATPLDLQKSMKPDDLGEGSFGVNP